MSHAVGEQRSKRCELKQHKRKEGCLSRIMGTGSNLVGSLLVFLKNPGYLTNDRKLHKYNKRRQALKESGCGFKSNLRLVFYFQSTSLF